MAYKTVEVPVGTVFGRLTTIGEPVLRPRSDGRNRSNLPCRCECGVEREFAATNLFSGNTTSCGCYHKETISARMTTHGMTAGAKNKDRPRIYTIWRGMRERCYNTKAQNYRWYGGKGVEVFPAWKDSFADFMAWSLANGYDKGLEIDRMDPRKHYEPSNCRWITKTDNLRNRHRFIPDYLQDRLSDYAKERDLSVANVIVEALEAYLPEVSGEVMPDVSLV